MNSGVPRKEQAATYVFSYLSFEVCLYSTLATYHRKYPQLLLKIISSSYVLLSGGYVNEFLP